MAEPFSKRFRKFLGAARFVRPSLLYGQIGHDRKNMAIMQDLTVTLEKIAKMQDEIIPPFCRFDSAKVLTDTVSVSTRENVTDILSATLRTNCPFGFGLRHFAADQNQNVKMSFWLVAVKMSGTSRRRIKTAKCKLDPWCDVADIFSATLPKSELHFAFLIFKGAFCALGLSQQCGVQNALHVKRVRASAWRSNCAVGGITPSHSTLIHHKRASRYVVLGEISLSPFTTYIFV